MLFVDLVTEQPKTKVQIKNENKNMSLPSSWTDNTLVALGVARVTPTPAPAVGEYQVVSKNGVVQDSSGNWIEAWQVTDMFTADSDGTVIEKQEAYDVAQLHQRRQGMTTTNANLRVAINDLGELNNLVTSSVLTSNPELEIRFNHTAEINRLDPWFIQATQGVLDSAQLDALFDTAMSY